MAALLRARGEIRRRWRSWAGLALLVAVAGGAVLALIAGAGRTDSAYPRFLTAKRAADVFLFLPDPGVAPTIQTLPETADFATATAMQPADTDLAPVVLTDSRFGRELNRFKFLEGHALNPDRPDDVVVSFLVARSRHLHVGDRLSIRFLSGGPTPLTATFRVAGVEAAPAEFPPRSATYNLPVYLSPAFLRTSAGAVAQQGNGTVVQLAVRLHHGL